MLSEAERRKREKELKPETVQWNRTRQRILIRELLILVFVDSFYFVYRFFIFNIPSQGQYQAKLRKKVSNEQEKYTKAHNN